LTQHLHQEHNINYRFIIILERLITCEGRLLVLNVPSGNFYDSSSITETAPVTKTFSTTIQSNTEALIIWSSKFLATPGTDAFISAGYRGWKSPEF
jgi:hypothetical protein